jgi:hypothetical protein
MNSLLVEVSRPTLPSRAIEASLILQFPEGRLQFADSDEAARV